jgi:hypothetical protein
MRKKGLSMILFLTLCFFILAIFISDSALAQYDYTPMEAIPGSPKAETADFPGFIQGLYKFGIWAVGIAALFMVTIGGFLYMASAGNTSKMDNAKGIIKDSLIGLFVALTAYLILFIINPDLVKINIDMKTLNISTRTSEIKTGGATVGTVSGGSCSGLSTQSGISSQCSDATPELTKMLECIKTKEPTATISSISDSQGYTNCVNNYNRPPCAHAQYSCHYGGKNCRGKGSYAVDFTTRNLSSERLKNAANACGADYALDEGNHVHASVGKKGGCGCN